MENNSSEIEKTNNSVNLPIASDNTTPPVRPFYVKSYMPIGEETHQI